MIAGVDGGGDEGGGLGVRPSNGEEVGAHDIGLGTDGYQAVDVLTNGHKDLSSHVTALLGARGLVLDVNTGGTLLNEELGKLHDSRQTTVTSVGISDDGPEVVDVGNLGALFFGGREAFLALLAIMEELGHEEMCDLVWHSGIGVVSKIRTGFVGCGSR